MMTTYFSAISSITRYKVIRGLTVIVALGLATRAQAAFHLWNITQIYSNSTGSLQFIEMFTTASSQQFFNGQSITVSNHDNTLQNSFTIPSDPNYSSIDSANHALLFGTAGLAAAGGPAPDFIIPDNFLFTGGGTINFFAFFGNTGLSYPALPTDGVHALTYNNGPVVVNSPQNYGAQTGQVELSGDVDQDTLVDVADISAMMSALSDLSKYQTTNNLSNSQLLRIANLTSGDNSVNNADLQALINLLANGGGSGSLSAVPEPAAIVLLAAGGLILLVVRARQLLTVFRNPGGGFSTDCLFGGE